MSKAKKAAQVKVPNSNAKFGDLLRAVLTSKAKPKAKRPSKKKGPQ